MVESTQTPAEAFLQKVRDECAEFVSWPYDTCNVQRLQLDSLEHINLCSIAANIFWATHSSR